MFETVVATSAERYGGAVCPPGTLRLRYPPPTTTFEASNWWEYGASPITQVLTARPAGSEVAVEKSKTSLFAGR